VIKYVLHKDLDIIKYDNCIATSINSRIYAFSWYLNCVADNWDVLVLNDYEAVMPLPKRQKYLINYVYTPFWITQLGIFFNNSKTASKSNILLDFLNKIRKKFKVVDLRLNTENQIENYNSKFLLERFNYELSLEKDYQSIFNNYKKERKKNLKKANSNNLTEVWNDSSIKLIELYKNNVGLRTPNIKDKDYRILQSLIDKCLEKKMGEIIGIYDGNKSLTSSAFILKNKNRVTILVSSTDFKNRNNGSNTFLIDTIIKKYANQDLIFDFGGSSIPGIASFFNSFGAIKKVYYNFNQKKIF
ncbi:MAG: hypothetical protein KAH67_03560, partial [Flavobacteriaceae bacterium]|nr:hypothetical protein [Flavobacteriaceae bacterium]